MKFLLILPVLLLAGCKAGSYCGVVDAPEIDPGSAVIALTLTAGIVAMIMDRRHR